MNKSRKRITIKDIAKETGVCFSTVSRVINNKKYVKKETREKVLDAIKNLDYSPNIFARGLRTKKTRAIGVIVPDISVPFYSNVVKAIEKRQEKIVIPLF